jgi:3-deoxy-D-manno-octulosonic-acid transferase
MTSAHHDLPHLTWGHWLYRLIATLLTGPVLLALWWRGRREQGYRQAIMERLGYVNAKPSALGGLWLHVASVGEAQAALNLRPKLEAQWGEGCITWTTQTPAARAFLLDRTAGAVQPFFAPLDTLWAVRRFMRRVQPRMLLLLERELWPEWLWQCEQRAVPVAVVNARLKQRSTQHWPYSSHWVRLRLQRLSLALCADTGSARRFGQLGVPTERIHTLGNLKFDQSLNTPAPSDLANELVNRTVLVAASTHEGDEDALLPGCNEWLLGQDESALLVLAPRHPKRFAAVSVRLQAMGWVAGHTLAVRSQGHAVGKHTKILLLDTIGELVHTYPMATLCLMGGTWSPVGGHNALEPLALGCPVLFGPHTEQFPALYADMADCGAARCVEAHEVWAQVQDIVHSAKLVGGVHHQMQKAGLDFIAAQQGSGERTLAQLATLPCWPLQPMPAIHEQRLGSSVVWACADIEPVLGRPIEVSSFDPAQHANGALALATGSGRGQVHRVEQQGQAWVLRHYRRGGWVARWVHDTYPSAATEQTRAMQELVLLRQMLSLGLPVPKPVAAHCRRHSPWLGLHSRYSADILIEHIGQTHNLVQRLREAPLTPKAWQAVGQAIARLHSQQVFHSDLNAHNVLLNDAGQVWVVDFDKCGIRAGRSWKASQLARLQRSLVKEQGRHGDALHWRAEADWSALMQGYRN